MILATALSWLASGAMIFGGVVPYIPQYLEIKRMDNSEGFSTYVCLALLVANTSRIYFWFGHHFELPLLAQSFIMIVTMLALLHLCTKVKHHHEVTVKRQRFTDFDSKYFWKWSYFSDYLQFMILLNICIGAATYLLRDEVIFIESLGFFALCTEAILGAPQFYRNFKNRSTLGMSFKMVLFWLIGDLFKTCYSIVKNAPLQFWFCGICQVTIDISILLQVFCYKKTAYL